MVVQIRITYCGAWGYRPKVQTFRDRLTKEMGEGAMEFVIKGTPETTGLFEIEANGILVHSKKNGDGFIDSEDKFKKIVGAVKTICGGED